MKEFYFEERRFKHLTKLRMLFFKKFPSYKSKSFVFEADNSPIVNLDRVIFASLSITLTNDNSIIK